MSENNNSSREFFKKVAPASAAITIVPSTVVSGLGHVAPSDKLNIAGVGVGGMGRVNLQAMNSQNIVSLCDVDWYYANKTFKDYPKANKYWDWRKMLYDNPDYDAVMIATPDHSHAIIAAHVMQLGKHVYVQQPLTLAVKESRLLTQLADNNKVVTQMGNQGNSGEGIRKICEWIWAGEIGDIKEVHAWTNRPIWPQGLERPPKLKTPPQYQMSITEMKKENAFSWNSFLGVAPWRPYNEIYTPWNWRGWWDFGSGALGDMACHILDPVVKSLDLKYPSHVEGSSTLVNTECAPKAQCVKFQFPARANREHVNMPEVNITWWDGGLLPPRPAELRDGEQMGRDRDGGCMFIGSKGILMCGCYGKDPYLVGRENPNVPKTLRRIELSHEMDWVRACKDGYDNSVKQDTLPSSNFSYAGPLNEVVSLGVASVRLQNLNRSLEWDGENMKFTNISSSDKMKIVKSNSFKVVDGDPKFTTKFTDEINAKAFAEKLIDPVYRSGWSLPKLYRSTRG